MGKKVPMPKEGEWFKIGSEVIHTCCDCKAKHRWQFMLDTTDDHIYVRITRVDKPRRKK